MTQEINNSKIGVGVFVLNEKNELLLMRRGKKARTEQGSWALPGGKVDPGETAEETAVREIKEEVNLEIKIENELTTYDCTLPNENIRWVTKIFLTKVISGTPQIMEPEKCDGLDWFALDSLPSPIAKMTKPAIEQYEQKKE